MESHTRTILKSLTWRAMAFSITTVTALALTGKMELAATIGIIDTAVKLFAYYAHERTWLKIKFGQAKAPEYEI